MQVKLWGIDLDEAATQLGASAEEISRATAQSQQDMSSLHASFPFTPELMQRFANVTGNPDMANCTQS